MFHKSVWKDWKASSPPYKKLCEMQDKQCDAKSELFQVNKEELKITISELLQLYYLIDPEK